MRFSGSLVVRSSSSRTRSSSSTASVVALVSNQQRRRLSSLLVRRLSSSPPPLLLARRHFLSPLHHQPTARFRVSRMEQPPPPPPLHQTATRAASSSSSSSLLSSSGNAVAVVAAVKPKKKPMAHGGSRGRSQPSASAPAATQSGRKSTAAAPGSRAKSPKAAVRSIKKQNGEKGADTHVVPEGYRIRLTRALVDLREDDTKQSLEFPPTLTNTERKFVHELSRKLGLKSKSRGTRATRTLKVTKSKATARPKLSASTLEAIPLLRVGLRGREALAQHTRDYPPTHDEALESHETGTALLEALKGRGRHYSDDDTNNSPLNNSNEQDDDAAMAARLDLLGLGERHADRDDATHKSSRPLRRVDFQRRIAQHAHAQTSKRDHRLYAKMRDSRSKLPAHRHCDEIVQTVARNPVTIVSGETGCGKSTQVPQFLLDANPGCCIAVTQPRRISAISIAERIAEEQCLVGGVGGLVGYQVRLDSAISNDTQLAFMTPGILLRKMQSAPQLTEYTHIVVDEIHERDKYQEFLLIVLRDLLAIRPDLRIILMSATLQTDTLVDYFESYGIQPAVIEMEGKMFPVQEYFLENVLEMTGYIDASTAVDGAKQLQLEQELAKLTGQTQSKRNQQQQQQQQQVANVSMQCAMCGRQNFASADELGEHIVECDGFFDADEDNAIAVKEKAATVNSLASTTSALLDLSRSDDGDVVKWDGEPQLVTNSSTQITALQQKLLDKYQTIHDDEDIDNNLLLEIVRYIVKSSYGDGGILIFLPGWKEISEFSRLLENTAPFYDETKFMILPLHSGIPSREQRRVLQWPPKGVRKIVLSTNIAETSLTIEDCVFVIDTGRAKEKNYEPFLKTSTLQPTWVSQASAKQRKGRAGRVKPGVCFHLFSSTRHQSLRQFTESELLRTPLEDMCLMCKQLGLAPGGSDDEDGIPAFLAKAMSAPHLKSVSNALELLVDLGAMQPDTNTLTPLGGCLSVLSLEPRVGKMVIWSSLLGCTRVASNMAVAMSYKSPFTLPSLSERQAADAAKVELSQDSESDQITVHNALERIEQMKNDGSMYTFCRRYFLGVSTIQMVADLRKNLARELVSLGFPNPSDRKGFHNRHDKDHALWYAALAAGLYPNVALRRRGETNFSTIMNRKLKVHVSSVNAARGQPFNGKSKIPEGDVEFVCYGEMVKGAQGTFTVDQTTRLSSPLPLLLMCGSSLSVEPHPDLPHQSILKLDDWIVFQCDSETAANIVVLRKRVDSAFCSAISNPSRFVSDNTEKDAVKVLGEVLTSTHILTQCPI